MIGCSPATVIGFLSAEPSLRDSRRQRAAAYQPRAQRSDALGTARLIDSALSRAERDRLPLAAAKRQRAVHRTEYRGRVRGDYAAPLQGKIRAVDRSPGRCPGLVCGSPLSLRCCRGQLSRPGLGSGHRIQGQPARCRGPSKRWPVTRAVAFHTVQRTLVREILS